MAIVNSIELNNILGKPYVPNLYRDVDSRARIMHWTFNPAGEVSGSTIRLGMLKKGWRLQHLWLIGPIIGQAGALLAVGVAGNTSKYVVAPFPVDVAVSRKVALLQANGGLEVFVTDTEIILTVSGADLLASATGPLLVEAEYTQGG
jgi:hypothetical protein